MNLYIFGTSSGNPKDWSHYNEFVLVQAETEEQARALSGDTRDCYVVEPIAGVLARMPDLDSLRYGVY